MLEGLPAVDWSKLHHAHGTAEDVPDQLRALISPDLKRREEALWALHGNIWHQGTIYEATSHAVPFLWEILAGTAPCDRSGVANLIGAIANGSGYNNLNPKPQEKVWIAECRAAVRQGLGIAESHLTSEDSSCECCAPIFWRAFRKMRSGSVQPCAMRCNGKQTLDAVRAWV